MSNALLDSNQHLDETPLKPNGFPSQSAGIQNFLDGSSFQPLLLGLGTKLVAASRRFYDVDQELAGTLGSQLDWKSTSGVKDVTLYLRKAKQGIEALKCSRPRVITERSFQKELEWLAENRHRFSGQWIALQGDQLLAAGSIAHEVFQQVADIEPPPLVIRIEPDDLPFGGW